MGATSSSSISEKERLPEFSSSMKRFPTAHSERLRSFPEEDPLTMSPTRVELTCCVKLFLFLISYIFACLRLEYHQRFKLNVYPSDPTYWCAKKRIQHVHCPDGACTRVALIECDDRKKVSIGRGWLLTLRHWILVVRCGRLGRLCASTRSDPTSPASSLRGALI